MLSMHSEETLVRQAMDAGARGYIFKNAVDLDLASAIKCVAAGETVLDPALVPSAPLTGERSGLTASSRCRSTSARASRIAKSRRACVSASTPSPCIAPNIMNTLGVHKTAELVVYAPQRGLVHSL